MAGTQGDPKRVWRALNQIANIKTKTTKDVAIDKISVEGRVITDRFEILETTIFLYMLVQRVMTVSRSRGHNLYGHR